MTAEAHCQSKTKHNRERERESSLGETNRRMVSHPVGDSSTADTRCRHSQGPSRKMVQTGPIPMAAIASPSWLQELCHLFVARMFCCGKDSLLETKLLKTFPLSRMAFLPFQPNMKLDQ